ncbi:MAG: hypothetical protein ABIS17_12830 [Casimicrobiaceae bacterium]
MDTLRTDLEFDMSDALGAGVIGREGMCRPPHARDRGQDAARDRLAAEDIEASGGAT